MKISIFFFAFSLSFFACGPKAKNYECTQYSVECELQKDLILVLPIDFDPTLTDVYGNVIQRPSNWQWYVLSPKVGVLAPVNFEVCIGGDINSGPKFTQKPTLTQISSEGSEWNSVHLDSVDISKLNPGVKNAVVVISGPNEVVRNFRNTVNLAK